jgi:TRAP-type C4-dicarboxylate transport system permease small subunit
MMPSPDAFDGGMPWFLRLILAVLVAVIVVFCVGMMGAIGWALFDLAEHIGLVGWSRAAGPAAFALVVAYVYHALGRAS